MDTCDPGLSRIENVCYRQVVIVVRMEIETQFRIAGGHLDTEVIRFLRVQDAQRIGQHKPFDRFLTERIDHLVNVLRRMAHAVGPVFQVQVDIDTHLPGIGNYLFYIVEMFFRCFAELFGHMLIRAFTQQVDHAASCILNPLE